MIFIKYLFSKNNFNSICIFLYNVNFESIIYILFWGSITVNSVFAAKDLLDDGLLLTGWAAEAEALVIVDCWVPLIKSQ